MKCETHGFILESILREADGYPNTDKAISYLTCIKHKLIAFLEEFKHREITAKYEKATPGDIFQAIYNFSIEFAEKKYVKGLDITKQELSAITRLKYYNDLLYTKKQIENKITFLSDPKILGTNKTTVDLVREHKTLELNISYEDLIILIDKLIDQGYIEKPEDINEYYNNFSTLDFVPLNKSKRKIIRWKKLNYEFASFIGLLNDWDYIRNSRPWLDSSKIFISSKNSKFNPNNLRKNFDTYYKSLDSAAPNYRVQNIVHLVLQLIKES